MLEVDGFYGQLLGLFELYSMGVHVPSAIQSYCGQVLATGGSEQMRSLGEQLDEYVAAVEGAEDSDGSCEEEEEEGEGEGEGEDEDEDTGEERVDGLAQDEMGGEEAVAPCAKRQRTAPVSPGAIEDSASSTDPRRQRDTESGDTGTEGDGSEEMLAQCEQFIADAAAGDLVDFPPLDATVRTSVATCSAARPQQFQAVSD